MSVHIDVLRNGLWEKLIQVDNNYQRYCSFAINSELSGIRFVLEQTWGSEKTQIYAFYIR